MKMALKLLLDRAGLGTAAKTLHYQLTRFVPNSKHPRRGL
jgi:hypothetical protein